MRRGLRGALAGGVAAAVWGLQQPIDKRVFACRFDDAELLGKLVTRGPAWPAVGLAMHVQNGAVFGALYALGRRPLPGPPVALGLAAAMIEHLGSWPLVHVTDRLHPARRELPHLGGNRRAFAQATWRHVLFGLVLGVLEERLNREPAFTAAQSTTHAPTASQNGSGRLDASASAPAGAPYTSGAPPE